MFYYSIMTIEILIFLFQYSEHKEVVFKACVKEEACTNGNQNEILKKMGFNMKVNGKNHIQLY